MKSVALTLRLEEDIYQRVKEVAQAHKTSFTAFVQSVLADVLKSEEKKALYDSFSLVGQDHELADIEFAVNAQREVLDRNE